MNFLMHLNQAINQVVWGPVMITLLLGFGLLLSISLRFFQFFKCPLIIKKTIGGLFSSKNKQSNGISPFQAVSTALAGTLGTGNIIGVGIAIVSGGPGAVFWMWISAFFGMMTKYAEVMLAVKFRSYNEKNEPIGGPMYYIDKGMKCKWLANVFCIFCILASFGIGSMVQSNSVSEALFATFHLSPLITGILLSLFAALVILGGIKRIGSICEKIVPLMALFYCIFVILALIVNASQIPHAFLSIVHSAFSSKSIIGGGIGYSVQIAIRYGFSRGIFSNEAGLGSAPIAHAAANTNSPVEQGMWGIFEVFFDTIISCTMTALVILTSNLPIQNTNGAQLTLHAFSSAIGNISQYVIAISMIFFAFASMIGWAYYGEKCIEYLLNKKQIISGYRFLYIFSIIIGAIGNLGIVWQISDTLNGLMAVPNMAALIFLYPVICKETKSYLSNHKRLQANRSLSNK